jgi:hypothetical protein
VYCSQIHNAKNIFFNPDWHLAPGKINLEVDDDALRILDLGFAFLGHRHLKNNQNYSKPLITIQNST